MTPEERDAIRDAIRDGLVAAFQSDEFKVALAEVIHLVRATERIMGLPCPNNGMGPRSDHTLGV